MVGIMKSVQAGKLRHRVTILSVAETITDAGAMTYSATTVATVWGELLPMSGAEPVIAGRPTPTATHRVFIRRYAGTLTPKYRLQIDRRTFEIVANLDVEGRKRLTEITCRELV